MTKNSRLTLTRDGERAFGRLADGIARVLLDLLVKERVKKKDLAERAGVDQAVLSRVLDGSRNVEIRTIGALYGALGYVIDVIPKRIHPSKNDPNNHVSPPIKADLLIGGHYEAPSVTTMTNTDTNQKITASSPIKYENV